MAWWREREKWKTRVYYLLFPYFSYSRSSGAKKRGESEYEAKAQGKKSTSGKVRNDKVGDPKKLLLYSVYKRRRRSELLLLRVTTSHINLVGKVLVLDLFPYLSLPGLNILPCLYFIPHSK